MSRERIITALDLGSHKIRVGVLLVGPNNDLKIIGLGESTARGIRRGQVIDIKEAAESIKEAVMAASKSGNIKISKLAVGLSGPYFKLMPAHGSIAVSRADSEISQDDVNRVLDSAKAALLPANKEIIHVLPLEYEVDREEKVKDPVGMKGVRLEANVSLILISTPVSKTVAKAVEQAGFKVESIIHAPLALGQAVLSKKQRELGVVVLDIGASTTNLTMWAESDLRHTSVLPIGSASITNDMAIGLKISPELSEKVKTEYGCCVVNNVSRREQVVLADWGADNIVMSKLELARIIEARASEIFELAAQDLKTCEKAGPLPAGAVLVGGGVKMEGMLELARKKLKLSVELGRIRDIKSDVADFFHPDFATLAGLLIFEHEREQTIGAKTGFASTAHSSRFLSKIKEWFYDLIP